MEWKDVVYGPVKSRRLGQSLGINLTPLELKVCNFSCGYCRVGVPSKGSLKPNDYKYYNWMLQNLRKAIATGLQYHAKDKTPIDYVTIAGNGEATLYPLFAKIVDYLIEQRNIYLPDKPTAIFTNATKINDKNVTRAIYRLDRRFFKLDAGDKKTFQRINMPLRISYNKLIQNLLSLNNFELSMAVLNGEISNYDSFFNSEFIKTLKKMKFTKIFLYDIDIPKTTSPRFNRKTEKGKLEDLAQYFLQQLNRKIGGEIVILWEPTTRENNLPLYPKQTN